MSTISRRRLAKVLADRLEYGAARRVANLLGIAEGRISRALRRPDEFQNDFCVIADHMGFESAATDGFFREKHGSGRVNHTYQVRVVANVAPRRQHPTREEFAHAVARATEQVAAAIAKRARKCARRAASAQRESVS